MSNRYTEEEFITAVETSRSVSGVLKKIGLKPAGGNYKTVNNLITELDLDISHFAGQSWNKGRTYAPKRNISEYLNNNFKISSCKLKMRLLSEGYLVYKCYKCDGIEWLGRPMPLELEHIDGNSSNNNLSNLTLLCPNCHAQTDTYRGKNIGKSRPA